MSRFPGLQTPQVVKELAEKSVETYIAKQPVQATESKEPIQITPEQELYEAIRQAGG
jgi:hypothetical protein